MQLPRSAGPRRSRLALAALACLAAGLAAGPAGAATGEPQPNWPLGYLNAEAVWEHSRGAGVVVGLVDSNVQEDHPDLQGTVLEQAFLDSRTSEPGDHGTNMASLIVGTGGQLIDGLAPDARLVVAGTGEDYPAIDVDDEGIVWAVDNGATVLNLSYSQGTLPRPDQQAAIEYALAHDVVVVAAAGNAPADSALTAPALYPGVIAVSAVDGSSQFCTCSVADPGVVVAAPGYQVVGASPFSTGYSMGDGTSPATAFVSATAALVRAAHPDLDAANVINRIIATARDVGPPGRDPQFGYGIIDPLAAVTAEVPLVDTNPLITPTPTTTAETSSPTTEPTESETTTPPQTAPTTEATAGGGSTDGGPGALPYVIGGIALVLVAVAVGLLVGRRSHGDPGGLPPP